VRPVKGRYLGDVATQPTRPGAIGDQRAQSTSIVMMTRATWAACRPLSGLRHHPAPADAWAAACFRAIAGLVPQGRLIFARIAMLRALNRHIERVFNPDRKDHHWGRRKLARDR